MSKEKTGDKKPHPRMDMQKELDRREHERNQAKKAQAKPTGPQPGGLRNRMNMPADHNEERPAKPRMETQTTLDRVKTMIQNLKKSLPTKSTGSKGYVERFKRAITKSNNKGNSR